MPLIVPERPVPGGRLHHVLLLFDDYAVLTQEDLVDGVAQGSCDP
jgi:hypothetical protein